MRHLIAAVILVATFQATAFAQSPAPAQNASETNGAAPKAQPFTSAKEIDLLTILAPPPANGSAKMQSELAEVLSVQVTLTPEQVARAQADVEENIWRFADAVNSPSFNPEKLPQFDAFFKRVFKSEGAVTDPAKKVFNRPRPFQYSDLVHPAVKPSTSGAYPSGHATSSTLAAIVLSNMLPEKRREIMARAWEFAENRIVGGMHYRTDIEAGHIAGSIIAYHIMGKGEFQKEYAVARDEVRAALGL